MEEVVLNHSCQHYSRYFHSKNISKCLYNMYLILSKKKQLTWLSRGGTAGGWTRFVIEPKLELLLCLLDDDGKGGGGTGWAAIACGLTIFTLFVVVVGVEPINCWLLTLNATGWTIFWSLTKKIPKNLLKIGQ